MRLSQYVAAATWAVLAMQAGPQTAPNQGTVNTKQTTTPADRGGNTPAPAAGTPVGPGQGRPGSVVGGPSAPVRERPSDYAVKQVDSEKAGRGKVQFGVTCAFCHGSDARGGEGGPNLIRSQLVLNDKNGETIAPVIQNGRLDRGMPKFDFNTEQITEIAAYLHSFKVGGYDASRKKPPSIVVGNAADGKSTFQSMCSSCHSLSGDLKAFGAKFDDPRVLQQAWIMPGGGGGRGMEQQNAPVHVTPTTVTVTLPSGKTAEGKLVRIDDFHVTLTDAEGYEQTYNLQGGQTKAVIHDPLEPHRQMLAKYTDKEIHDITAYLVTLK